MNILDTLKKYWCMVLKLQDYSLGVWSCRAMQWRGYSKSPIHPKHLFDERRSEYIHQLFRPDIHFLDIGSGVGTECRIAMENGATISVGLESNLQSIATAIERGGMNEDRAVYIQFDLEHGTLPFRDSCFDLINFSNVLEHLHNRASILSELKRVKKEDGLAVISIPNSQTAWKKKLASVGLDSRDDPDHKIEYSKQSLTQALTAAGLRINSDLMPIIPSWPWNGIIAMSAAVSPRLYKRLQAYKRSFVLAHPEDSIGWVFTVT